MRRGLGVVVLVLGLVLPVGAQAQPASGTSVSVDRMSISTRLGKKFTFQSTISNRGSSTASGLIAHLNVLSLRPGVYVDPEDWSSNRTRYLAPIPAGGSATVTWRVQAVNAGSIGVYVAVLPRSGVGRPAVGPTVNVQIAERKTLNSGGILPLALGVPALLGALTLGLRYRRGSSSRPAAVSPSAGE
jgi:hypothetical protein